MWRGIMPLTSMRPSDFIYFSTYTLSWKRALVLLFLLHANGVLWSSSSAPVIALYHTSGNLRAPLQDVHVRVEIGASVPPLPPVVLR
jgi:hypothetical protein